MINNSRLKTLSLIFAILSAIALVVCLLMAITLPSVSVYDTVFGTVRATRPGTFDMDYLAPIILLAMGTFWGFGLFGSIEKCGRKHHCHKEEAKNGVEDAVFSEKKEEEPEDEKNQE